LQRGKETKTVQLPNTILAVHLDVHINGQQDAFPFKQVMVPPELRKMGKNYVRKKRKWQ
jgi:hypothetical protein